MSTLPSQTQYLASAENDRPRQGPEVQMTNEDITELDRFLQSPSTTPASQVTGARELLKAGQRRLRQLAQLQWKPMDPKIKAEETSRHLLVLQQEGFLSLPASAAKKSLDSAMSGSRSASNFGFRSSSQRDVEKIGQPWLENPLEVSVTQHIKSPEPSPLDLGNLTSMVEAAVSFPFHFDDAYPPPYQPPANTTSDQQIEGQDPHHVHSATCQLKPKERCMEGQGAPSAVNPRQVPTNGKGHIPPTVIPRNGVVCDDPKDGKSQALDSAEDQNNSAQLLKPPAPRAKAGPRDPPNLVAQSLKLFPDTMPPRVSSKGAWRIPNNRIAGKDAPISAKSSGRHQFPAPVASKRKTDNVRNSAKGSSECQSEPQISYHSGKGSTTRPGKPCSEPAMSPIHPEFPQLKNARRPASLPTGTIDSFPLPAPSRPLPSLPERPPALNSVRHHSTAVRKAATRKNPNHSDAFRTTTSKNRLDAEHCRSNTQSALPQLSLVGEDSPASEQCKSAQETPPNHPESSGKVEQNRADRVRSLKFRDMMASRISLDGPETPLEARKGDGINTPASPMSSGTGHELRTGDETGPRVSTSVRKEATPSAPLSPPLSPPAAPPRARSAEQLPFSRRHGSSATDIMRASTERREPSLPASDRSATLHRSKRTRSIDVLHELVAGEQNTSNRAGSPLPSSDDECVDKGTFMYEVRQDSSRYQRTKVASRKSSNLCLSRQRGPRKSEIPDHAGLLTPRRQRSRISKGTSSSSLDSSSPYHSHDPRDRRDKAAHALDSLEGRIEQLERQNRILQAALFAALDVGVKPNAEALLGASTTSLSASANSSSAERSSPSSADRSSKLRGRAVANGRRSRMKKSLRRPESWIDSPGSSLRSDYQSDDSVSVRDLEDMIEDLEFTCLTDKPGSDRMPIGRI
ncbi:hypothetical protein IFM58399_07070 [Aspergillus lentulus]|uniref:Uncharacterized protein n=1 Tax=Aspergillus lentulus TaxID=293939 RepID=A0ABQ1AQ85_ASPLE|nr:uncharacterized protein IFM58399_07070 [Aspergillus lentulus]GFF43803.1 hypothetical protein IFM58399_07070 [Aspergillus lentulus]GFF67871.1 hypothetical protein IFM62136_07090 [Aspergillus lentulus]GFF84243.1 hypothetical protein IFM47457_06410 [Aspergillus lentulus]GFF86072.1 hypothetical protein IFM60648_07581 [Aspergillus lentulus]GFG09835.1 hypothetical protein IFM61392_06088 [Aspergillus lentulus]